MLYCFTWTETGNETGSTSDVLGAYLDICGTIISNLNLSPRSTLTKVLFLVMIEALIVCSNDHENMVLHSTTSPRAKETINSFTFTTQGFL